MRKTSYPGLEAACPERVRVWSAGCAMGQEVYSFGIAWMMQDEKRSALLWLEMWATDLDEGILEKARKGIYPASSFFLRNNLLTYHQEPVRVAAFARIAESLENSGYLVIGRDERVPPGYGAWSSVGSSGCLYRKKIQEK